MATVAAIGKKREQAMERIEALLPGFQFSSPRRDREYTHAQHLEEIADRLESLLGDSVGIGDDTLDAVRELVSKPDTQWKKADVKAILLGDD